MIRLARIAKLLVIPGLLVAGLVVVQAVVAVPAANFSFAVSDPNPAAACKTVTFTNTSDDPDAPGTTWETVTWDIDGVPYTGPSAVHEFTTLGPHTVTMTATDTDPEPDDVSVTKTDAAFQVPNAAPTAIIQSAPTRVDPNEAFTLTGSGTDDGSVKTLQWDLDANGFDAEDPTGPSVVNYKFPTSGNKTIALRAIDNCDLPGAAATATVQVTDAAPIGSIAVAPLVARKGLPVKLTASASDVGGAITFYEWDLNGNGIYNEAGEPSGAALNEVQPTFQASGNHKVGVRLTDNSTPAKTSEAVNYVWVNFPPEADFAFDPTPPLIGDSLTFRLTRAEDVDGNASDLAYEWDLDGDGAYEHTGATPPAHSYATAGARSASLRVTDNLGDQTVVTKGFEVGSNQRPDASFRVSPAKPVDGDEVTFTSTSDDPDDRLTKQEWDFNGDGRYDDTGRVVSRRFKKGSHRVTLRVTDSRAATATAAQTLAVGAKPLKPVVDVKRSLGYIPQAWGIRLVILVVKVPSKTTVAFKCTGRGCPRGTFKQRSKKKAAQLRFTKLKGSVRAGAKLTLITTRAGHIPAYDTWTVRGDKRRPLLREGCKPPGAKKARKLSSC